MSSSRKRTTRETMVQHATPQQQQFPTSALDLPLSPSMDRSTVQRRLTVRIKRIHAVARWSWNAGDPGDVCSICQNAYEGTAPGIKYPGEDCPVVFGRCRHAFHLQCVSKWLQQASSKNSCPICRQDWEFGSNPTVNANNAANSANAASNNNDDPMEES